MTIQTNNAEPIINPIYPSGGRRILLLSLEFNYSPFSGNGVLARSIVSSLIRRKDVGVVRVICAKPHPLSSGFSKEIICINNGCNNDDNGIADLEIWPVELPQHCQWKRLDNLGPWYEYSSRAQYFANNVKEFQPTDIVTVDWHGVLAWETIRIEIGDVEDDGESSSAASIWHPDTANVCYYNFRVYSHSDDDESFYREKEQLSCRVANVIICLSEHDRGMLQRLIEEDDGNDIAPLTQQQQQRPIDERGDMKTIHILYPPLRGDIWELAAHHNDKDMEYLNQYLPQEANNAIKQIPTGARTKQRMFITCCARLSPEKQPHHFVTLLKKLGGEDFLRRNFLIPILCGARSVEEYAKQVVHDFHDICTDSSDGETWPCVVINRHLGPKELAAIYSRTVVNVHPCLYDAYGMTLVESAAFGAPSIVNHGGKVGAASLLGEEKGCIAVDLETILESNGVTDDDEQIKTLLAQIDHSHEKDAVEEDTTLRQVAKEAKSQALGYDEMACCQGLLDILNGL